MAAPARFVAGFTQDQEFQPLGLMGFPDPFFCAVDQDDFLPYRAGDYTLSQAGAAAGTAAATAGAGGLITLTTSVTTPAATDFTSIQRPVASYAVQATQKLAYLCSFTAADTVNPGFRFGLMAISATPFTGLPDGIYFTKASAATQMTLQSVVGGVVTGSAVVPYTLVNAQQVNFGFVYAPQGNAGVPSIVAFAGNQLVGQATVDYNTIALGPVARVIPTSYPAVNMSPTFGILAGTATSKTVVLDYQLAALER